MKTLLAALAIALLSACVYVPRTTEVYDSGCRIQSKQMTLEPVQIAHLGQCVGSGCGALLVVAGATAAASAVVSGSIVVVGNLGLSVTRNVLGA